MAGWCFKLKKGLYREDRSIDLMISRPFPGSRPSSVKKKPEINIIIIMLLI
jgi:hypothetical protein